MLKFIKRIFRRGSKSEPEVIKDPCTLNGVPCSKIMNGDHLEWTDEKGKKVSGFVIDHGNYKSIQIDAFLSVPLMSVIEKSKLI